MCSTSEQEVTPGSVNPEVTVEEPRPDGASPDADDAVRSIVDQIMKLDLVQIVAMRNLMAERLGIDPNASVGVPMAGGAGAGADEGAAAAEEKTEFTVKLAKFDAGSKIKIIKEVRALTGLGLKEAKAAVEDAPTVLKENIPKEDADAIVEKLKAVGAECELE